MPVTVEEKFTSRSGDSDSQELLYVIRGTDDDAEVRSALLANSPATFNNLVRQKPHVEPVGPQLWDGRVRYQKYTPTRQTGESSFSFDTAGGTQHITQSRQTIGRYALEGGTAPDFGGAIGVSHDAVEGVDITVPVFSFSVTRYLAVQDVTPGYFGQLYFLTGKVNQADWSVNVDGVQLSFAAGECLFLGGGGNKRGQEDWELSFRFAASPNASDLTIGTISGISKKGWQYLWVRYADGEDTAAKAVVKKPVAVYVEKVYEEGDFSILGLS